MADFLKKLLKKEHAGVLANLMETTENRLSYCGDPSLDWAIKGWHTGGINLIYGPSGSGKTAIALAAAAAEWKKDETKFVLVYDTEYLSYKDRVMYERMVQFGIDASKIIYIPGNLIADLYDTLPDLEEDVKSGKLRLAAIVKDSLGGIQNMNAENKITKGEAGAAGDAHRGNAKSMNPILGVFNRMCAEHNIPAFVVQHCIKNQEMYGEKWVLLGGERLKFLSQRAVCVESSAARDGQMFDGDIMFNSTKPAETEGLQKVGKKILAKCTKSRGGMEGCKAEFWFNFKEARYAKPEVSLFNLAVNLGIIYHPGGNNSWWAYSMVGNEVKAHGQSKMQEILAANREVFDRILSDCKASVKTTATTDEMSAVVLEGEATS